MNKNKYFFGVFFFLLLSFGAFLSLSDVSAAGLEYKLLEKIPGFDSTNGSDLPKYITAVYNLALAVVILSAVLMVSVGGFMYLTSAGNTASMGTAKGIIFDALIGLVIALSAWLLLNTINPDLTTVSIKGITISGGGGPGPTAPPGETPPGETPPGGTLTDAEARKRLSDAGISVNHPEPQTSLAGIPASTITNIINLKTVSGCEDFRVTGGTEPGHQTHGVGKAVVDVTNSLCLKTFLRNKANLSGVHITAICAIASEQAVAYNCRHIEGQPHFHLVFTK